MKSFLLSFLAALALLFGANARTDAFYTTQGVVTVAPQIDALVWTNRDSLILGIADIEPALVFETQNTTRFVNRGVINISPGIRFETINDQGVRSAASDFINRGEILSPDYDFLVDVFDDPLHRIFGGRISIWATNITSPGYITGLHAGDISIRGENVDLSRGGVGNDVIFASVGLYDGANLIFNPELGFSDRYWRNGTFDRTIGVNPIGGDAVEMVLPQGGDPNVLYTNLAVPFFGFGTFPVTTSSRDGTSIDTRGFVGGGMFQVFVQKFSVATNIQVFDVAFVRVQDTNNVNVDVTWSRNFVPNAPPYSTAFIHLASVETNVVRGVTALNEITFLEDYASFPVDALFRNTLSEFTYQPTNLFALRGNLSFGDPTNRMFFSSGGTNMFTHWIDDDPGFPITFTNYYPMSNSPLQGVTYSTWAGNMDWRPSALQGEDPVHASLTNIAGRVYIDAKNLNLNRTRIQGQGVVVIKAENLISTQNAVVDGPYLSLDLKNSTNLTIRSLASGQTKHLGGSFAFFSTTISNTFTYTFTNAPADPTQAPTTEDASYVAFYHVTVLDTDFQSLRSQEVEDVRLTGDRVTIGDPLPVGRDLLVDAKDLVVDNNFGRPGFTTVDLTSAEFPRLETLEVTPNGRFSTQGLFETGNDDGITLKSIINQGSIQGGGVRLAAETIQNDNELLSGGQLDLRAGILTGTAGTFTGAFGLSVRAGEMNVTGAVFSSDGDMSFDISTANFSGIEIDVTTGLTVTNIPSAGDFNGAKIVLSPPDFSETSVIWPALDLGATVTGYQGNAAVGELALNYTRFSAASLRGSGERNAMYVSLLTLSDEVRDNLEDYLFLYPNITLYFADASPNISPAVLDGYITPHPITGEPGKGGKLVYLPSGVAPSQINATVGLSADGTQVQVRWNAQPGAKYEVQSRPLSGGAWSSRQTATSGSVSQNLSFEDGVSAGGGGMLYRVVVVQ